MDREVFVLSCLGLLQGPNRFTSLGKASGDVGSGSAPVKRPESLKHLHSWCMWMGCAGLTWEAVKLAFHSQHLLMAHCCSPCQVRVSLPAQSLTLVLVLVALCSLQQLEN